MKNEKTIKSINKLVNKDNILMKINLEDIHDNLELIHRKLLSKIPDSLKEKCDFKKFQNFMVSNLSNFQIEDDLEKGEYIEFNFEHLNKIINHKPLISEKKLHRKVHLREESNFTTTKEYAEKTINDVESGKSTEYDLTLSPEHPKNGFGRHKPKLT